MSHFQYKLTTKKKKSGFKFREGRKKVYKRINAFLKLGNITSEQKTAISFQYLRSNWNL